MPDVAAVAHLRLRLVTSSVQVEMVAAAMPQLLAVETDRAELPKLAAAAEVTEAVRVPLAAPKS